MPDNGHLLLTHFHSFESLSDQPHSNRTGVRSELCWTASRSRSERQGADGRHRALLPLSARKDGECGKAFARHCLLIPE
ncbi:Hypothetical predicted protein [Marmota monax]|uniref:Uncharacterized protein n=1 Tax=Marmota monax TaxID=9995 RepID=A0A5E4C4D8_MARMO|nr:hypothetical protein GHT09_010303 [Marmota monax]VTJ75979.1 Hypothetical predicted protein [Marmota monax]